MLSGMGCDKCSYILLLKCKLNVRWRKGSKGGYILSNMKKQKGVIRENWKSDKRFWFPKISLQNAATFDTDDQGPVNQVNDM